MDYENDNTNFLLSPLLPVCKCDDNNHITQARALSINFSSQVTQSGKSSSPALLPVCKCDDNNHITQAPRLDLKFSLQVAEPRESTNLVGDHTELSASYA